MNYYNTPLILDATCGTRAMWFVKENPLAIYTDNRQASYPSTLDGRSPWIIDPNIVCDFTAMPFKDNTFNLVLFDPPHMDSLGKNAWMAKRYGRLFPDWESDIKGGFFECFRVLKPGGTLVFKWNETDIKLSRILKLTREKPLFGHTTNSKQTTHWMVFMKHSSPPWGIGPDPAGNCGNHR